MSTTTETITLPERVAIIADYVTHPEFPDLCVYECDEDGQPEGPYETFLPLPMTEDAGPGPDLKDADEQIELLGFERVTRWHDGGQAVPTCEAVRAETTALTEEQREVRALTNFENAQVEGGARFRGRLRRRPAHRVRGCSGRCRHRQALRGGVDRRSVRPFGAAERR